MFARALSKQSLKAASQLMASTSSASSSRLASIVVPSSSSVSSIYNTYSSRSFSSTTEPSEKVKKLSEELLNLTTVEMNQLVFTIQTKLGITDEMIATSPAGANANAAAAAAPAAAPEPVKVKDSFNIKLGAVDQKAKIKVIKEVRAITGLGLKEAKELVEKAPVVIKEGVKKEEAEGFKKLLVESGATVELE